MKANGSFSSSSESWSSKKFFETRVRMSSNCEMFCASESRSPYVRCTSWTHSRAIVNGSS